MSFLRSRPGENVQYLVQYLAEKLPWAAAAKSGLLVDVGGAKGSVAMEISRHLPEIKFVVQDRPEVVEDTEVPEDLRDRLRLMGHDFFFKNSQWKGPTFI